MSAGNNQATATSLNLGSTPLSITGDTVTAALPDFYTFRLLGRSSLNFTLNTIPATGDVNFELLAGNGTTLVRNSTNGGTLADSINLVDQSPGTYYLRVYTTSATAIEYSLNLTGRTNERFDLIWRNYGSPGVNGVTSLWTMVGVNPIGTVNMPFTVTNPAWEIVGSGDFNKDGIADLVWRNHQAAGTSVEAGLVYIWTMDANNNPTGTVAMPLQVANPNWRIDGVGDFNRDGQPDLVWRNYEAAGTSAEAGLTSIWTMNGVTPFGTIQMPLRVANPNWRIDGVGDFNGDGQSDLVWRNYEAAGTSAESGLTSIWTMNGVTPFGTIQMPLRVANPNWRIDGVGDFNGDGQSDLVWRNYETTGGEAGLINIWTMNGVNPVGTVQMPLRVTDPNWRINGTRPRYDVAPAIDQAGNTPAAGFKMGPLTNRGDFYDRLDSSDGVDFYRFTVNGNRYLNLVLSEFTSDVSVQLFRDGNTNGVIDPGEEVALSVQTAPGSKFTNPSLTTGTYFLRFAPTTAGATTPYRFTLDGSTYTHQDLATMPASLPEASGLVRGAGDYWWTIQDSGNSATLYALDRSGQVIAIPVTGATNVDWEDIAAGPAPDGNGRVLFIGDFGNNTTGNPLIPNNFPLVSNRTNQVVYMVREPSLTATSVPVLQALELDFPSGNYDIEAMVYDPQAQQLVFITKDLNGVAAGGGVSRIFTRSLVPTETVLAEVATFDLTSRPTTTVPPLNQQYGLDRLVTGAALSNDLTVFVIRTYESVFRWVRTPTDTWSSLFQRSPQIIDLAFEPQGEGIAFGNSSNEFFTVSELAPTGFTSQSPKFVRYYGV